MPGIHQQIATAFANGNSNSWLENQSSHSALVHVLLKLWCVGRISAATLQQIAYAAVVDGCNHEELGVFASMGAWGSQPANCTRDLKRELCKSQQLSAQSKVWTQMKNTKTNLAAPVQASVILPHKLFADMYSNYNVNFLEVFGVSLVPEFWQKINMNDTRIAGHSGLPRDTEVLKLCIPGWVHGDAAEYHDRDSLMTWSWGSILALEKASLMSSFLFAAWPKLATSSTTWEPLMQVFVWSLLALAEGKWPSRNFDGNPWPPGSADADKAGKPLADGWRFVVLALLGDQEHFSNNLGMPHWNKNRFCWLCDCCKHGPIKKQISYVLTDSEIVFRTIEEELASPTSNHPLFSLGLTCFNIMIDILHAWDQGVWSHLAGSFLKDVIFDSYKHLPRHAALAEVWQKIQTYYAVLNTRVRLSNLTLAMIVGDALKPDSNWPKLKAKAAETRHLIPILCQIAEDLNDGSSHAKHRYETLKQATNLQKIIELEGMFMSQTAQECLVSSSKAFLVHYSCLKVWANENNFVGYHVVPKFHMGLVHLPTQASFLNPRFFWTYKAEDWVGRNALIAHSASFGTKSFLLSHKLIEKNLMLLHLSFTRGFFDD